jgi:hypothetical protein
MRSSGPTLRFAAYSRAADAPMLLNEEQIAPVEAFLDHS